MTLASLWLPALDATPTGPPPVPTLKQTNTTTITPGGSSPFSVTLPGSYTTVLNDCILVGMCIGGSNALTFSGCGATWTAIQEDAAPRLWLAVGYGCSAGGTSISVTGTTSTVGDIVVSVWSNLAHAVSPVASSVAATSAAAAVANLTSPSISYAADQLVLAVGGAGSTGFAGGTPPVWGDSATNTNVFVSNSQRATRVDYEIPAGSGSTTVEEILSTGTTTMRVIVAALNHS